MLNNYCFIITWQELTFRVKYLVETTLELLDNGFLYKFIKICAAKIDRIFYNHRTVMAEILKSEARGNQQNHIINRFQYPKEIQYIIYDHCKHTVKCYDIQP